MEELSQLFRAQLESDEPLTTQLDTCARMSSKIEEWEITATSDYTDRLDKLCFNISTIDSQALTSKYR